MPDLFFGIRNPGSGFHKAEAVFLIGILCVVETLLKGAPVPVGAAIADIGRLCKPGTFLFDKIRTVPIAFLTETAVLLTGGGAVGTEETEGTVFPVETRVIGMAIGS